MTKYIQRTDGEGFVVPLEEKYRLACCDCGLVHDIVWAYDEETKELKVDRFLYDRPKKSVKIDYRYMFFDMPYNRLSLVLENEV